MAEPVAAFAAGEKRDRIIVVMDDRKVYVGSHSVGEDGEIGDFKWGELTQIPGTPPGGVSGKKVRLV